MVPPPPGVAVNLLAGIWSGPAALLLATEEALGEVELALAVAAGGAVVADDTGAPGEVGVVAWWEPGVEVVCCWIDTRVEAVGGTGGGLSS